ncbi:MAG: carbamoyltransferase HypF, partial [Acetomicrobium sp.]|nr:carbamoyltransferase HypF [Acetomicrobium sp.]
MSIEMKKIFLVKGVVQGVGFRPFCSKLAKELKLGGSVQNNSSGVLIELHGDRKSIELFAEKLLYEAPPLAMIQSVESIYEDEASTDSEDFIIRESEKQDIQKVLIPPDIATCEDCLKEMRDPNDKRYRYPFINCTNCGPRYTIIKELPYDRTKTTMACFPMCDECRKEYSDVSNRRYHAQPNACPNCGPTLWLCDAKGEKFAINDDAVLLASKYLREGKILAIKGIGGYHLACDPR